MSQADRPRAVKKRRRRRRRLLLGLVALVTVIATVNFWTLLAPEHLESRLRQILDERLAFPYEFDSVHYGILDGLTIENLRVASPNAAVVSDLFPDGSVHPNILEVARVHLDLGLAEIIGGEMPIRRVTLIQPKIFVEIEEDLSTPLGRLIRPSDEPSSAVALPEVIVEQLEVHTCPRSTFRMKEPLEVDRFSLTLLDDRDYEFSGTAEYPLVRRVRLSGTGNRDDSTFQGKLAFTRLNLDASVRERLPERFREVWDQYRPSGMANASLEFSIAEGRVEDWRIQVQVIEANLTLVEPPLELASVNGVLEVVPERTSAGDEVVALRFPGAIRTLRPLRGRAFGGEAELSGSLDLEDLAVVGNDLSLRLEHVPLEERTREYLVGSLRKAYDALYPRGYISLELGIRGGADPEINLDRVELEDVTIRPENFAYPIEGLTGEIAYQDDRYSIRLDGGTEATPIKVAGFLGLEKGAAAHVQVRVENLALDSRLRRALPDDLQDVWNLVGPGGLTDLELSIVREPDAPRALAEVKLLPTNASVRYRDFPYLVTSVTGIVTVTGELLIGEETRYEARAVIMEDLHGVHGDSDVILDVGELRFSYTEEEASTLILRLRSPSLKVEDDVIDALPPDAARLVRHANLDGRLGTKVLITVDKAGELEIEVQTEIASPVTARYRALPYPVTLRKGRATFTMSDGSMRFEDFETDPRSGPLIKIQGYANPGLKPDERRLFVFLKVEPGLQTPGLQLDDPVLVKSLPVDARNILERLQVRGYANCDLRIQYGFSTGEEAREQVEYEGDVTLIGGAGNVGIEVEEVDAKLAVAGRAGPGPEDHHRFSVNVDDGSFRFSRFLTQNIQASFFYGEEHPIITRAREVKRGAARVAEYLPREEFVARLSGAGQTTKTLQMFIRDADLYGGDLRGFFFVDVGRNKDFMGDFDADGVDLGVGGPEIFKSEGILGVARGRAVFSGAIDAPERLWGKGDFSITDARLQQIPLMANVLRNPLFGVLEGLDPEQNYVRRVRGEFSIDPRQFKVHKYEDLDLETGNGVAFKGKGTMDFEQKIDLLIEPQGSFYSVPLLGTFLDSTFRMRLHGSLDDPKVSLAPYR